MLARVICADARVAASFDSAFGSTTSVASLLLADPPYLLLERRRRLGDARGSNSRGPRKLDEEGVLRFRDEAAYQLFMGAWMRPAFARLHPGGTAAVWTNALGRRATLAAAAAEGWSHVIGEFAWAKRTVERATNSTAGEENLRVYERAILLSRDARRPVVSALDGLAALSGYASASGHPHEKPFAAVAPLVRALSKRGETVLVPFAGCGGEAATAARLGRGVAGMELRREWADEAIKAVAEAARRSKDDPLT